jgi:hypothetical protein
MAGETGIGEALKKLATLYAAVSWPELHATGYGKLHDHAEVDAALQKAKAHYAAKVEPMRTHLRAIQKLANEVAAKFKANKLIPSSSTKHVLNLAAEADRYAVELKSLDAEFKSFDEYKQKLDAQIKQQKDLMKASIQKLAAGIQKTLANPTKQEWVDSMAQQCRSIANGIKVVPEWNKTFWSTWEKNDGIRFQSQLKGGPEDADPIKAECNRIKGDLMKLISGLK